VQEEAVGDTVDLQGDRLFLARRQSGGARVDGFKGVTRGGCRWVVCIVSSHAIQAIQAPVRGQGGQGGVRRKLSQV
jgi:hypothetical protein